MDVIVILTIISYQGMMCLDTLCYHILLLHCTCAERHVCSDCVFIFHFVLEYFDPINIILDTVGHIITEFC